jgi:hypothetical protein
MSEIKQDQHPHGDPNGGTNRDGRPYWKRAHRDWRFWAAVGLMFAAMVIYVMSDDLAGWTRGRPRQPISSAVGN